MSNFDVLVVAPQFALQLLIDGMLFGAIFALAAYGMALVWGVMNIINVTQGEFVMLGGFVTVVLAKAGLPALLSIPVAAACLFAVGWVGHPRRHHPAVLSEDGRPDARHCRRWRRIDTVQRRTLRRGQPTTQSHHHPRR